MNVKQKFPNEEALKTYIKVNLENITSSIEGGAGHLEAGYVKAKRDRALGFALIGLGSSPWFISDILFEVSDPSPTIMLTAVIAGIPLMIIGWKKQKGTHAVISDFNKELNILLFTKVFNIFGFSAKFVSTGGSSIQNKRENSFKFSKLIPRFGKALSELGGKNGPAKKLLDDSELITEARNRFVSDDTLEVDLGERKMLISELDIKNVTGSGKNRRVKKIFHGYFFAVDLPRELTGKTFVTTEGDTVGFGNQSMFSKGGVSKTELEWNDFENKLHVSTSDPVEARYILTTDFMSDLYDWWREKEQRIRVSFIGKKMFFIYPDKKIRINSTIKKISTYEIGEYLESICIPLLHSLYLVEDAPQ